SLNLTPTSVISTPPLHDALPIYAHRLFVDLAVPALTVPHPVADPPPMSAAMLGEGGTDGAPLGACQVGRQVQPRGFSRAGRQDRSGEHTSELQSRVDLVCRLLLE